MPFHVHITHPQLVGLNNFHVVGIGRVFFLFRPLFCYFYVMVLSWRRGAVRWTGSVWHDLASEPRSAPPRASHSVRWRASCVTRRSPLSTASCVGRSSGPRHRHKLPGILWIRQLGRRASRRCHHLRISKEGWRPHFGEIIPRIIAFLYEIIDIIPSCLIIVLRNNYFPALCRFPKRY